jgi:hypothetical protein
VLKSPNIFWAKVVSTTIYLQNRLHAFAFKNKTLKKTWLGKNPCVAHLCIKHILISKRKLKEKESDSKTLECILIGYNESVKGYCLYILNTKSVIISHNVAFKKTPKTKKEHNHRDIIRSLIYNLYYWMKTNL